MTDSGKALLNNKEQFVIYLAAQGLKNSEIADIAGMTPSSVASLLNQERTQFEVKRLRYQLHGRDTQKRFKQLAELAVDATEEIMTDPNGKPALKLIAAKEILDRAFGKPKQTVQHEGSLIRNLLEKLDGKGEAAPIIDVTPDQKVRSVSENPNETRPIDTKENPNLSSDPIDAWANENL